MKTAFRVSRPWTLWFLIKILGLLVVFNLVVLPILWGLQIPHLFVVVLTYEGLFVAFLGVLQILASYIYKEDREDSTYYRREFGTEWFDFKKFAKSTPEERKRYRQEGIIMVIVGLGLLVGIVVLHFQVIALFLRSIHKIR